MEASQCVMVMGLLCLMLLVSDGQSRRELRLPSSNKVKYMPIDYKVVLSFASSFYLILDIGYKNDKRKWKLSLQHE